MNHNMRGTFPIQILVIIFRHPISNLWKFILKRYNIIRDHIYVIPDTLTITKRKKDTTNALFHAIFYSDDIIS